MQWNIKFKHIHSQTLRNPPTHTNTWKKQILTCICTFRQQLEYKFKLADIQFKNFKYQTQNTHTNRKAHNIQFQIRKHTSYNFKSIQKQTLKHAIATLNKKTQNLKPTTHYLHYKINCNHNSIQQTHYYNFK